MLEANATDTVFQALAHASRRQMLDLIQASPGIPVGELANQFDVSRIAVMKHLRVLEEAGLVASEKIGRSRKLYFNAIPIQMIYDRWTDDYSAWFASSITQLKYAAEQRKTKTTGHRAKRQTKRGDSHD